MGKLDFKDGIMSDHFFSSGAKLDITLNLLAFCDKWEILSVSDKWEIQYCEEYGDHVLLHDSFKFKEKRAICTITNENFCTKNYLQFIMDSLRLAWAEYII
jgi:hypothetical protein